MDAVALSTQVARLPWYHTLELGDGVVTQGMFDHRPVIDHYGLPADLSGLRCLDVGTMDGFWAFELERRGAAEVTALDLEDPEALDWPASIRAEAVKALDESKADRFALARDALGSRVRRVGRSVYDLGPDLGTFDLVFCGDLLVHLKDPVTAVERLRSVCEGRAIVCNPIKRFRFAERRAMAELDGVGEFTWWVTNLTGLVQVARAAGFARVEAREPFELPFRGEGRWKGLRGVVHAYV
jgi:tRNA (mo5U34)-methyltransferase